MARRPSKGKRGGKRRFEEDLGDETRDDHIKLEGTVSQVFAGGQFEVQTDAGAAVRAQLPPSVWAAYALFVAET